MFIRFNTIAYTNVTTHTDAQTDTACMTAMAALAQHRAAKTIANTCICLLLVNFSRSLEKNLE